MCYRATAISVHKSTEQSASSGAVESSRGERTQRPQEVSLDIVSRGISSRNPAAHFGDLVEEYSISCDHFHSVEKRSVLHSFLEQNFNVASICHLPSRGNVV